MRLAELPTRAEREPVLRAGEGGDDTTAVDAAAEAAVVSRLQALGADLTLVSEELGVRTFGAGGPPHVVVDPIDGSVNAKRGIPYFSLSLAVAEGPAMADVAFGLVHDFGAGEEWVAERGSGGLFWQSGRAAIGSQLPVNTHGGMLSHAHAGAAGGMFGLIEAVAQLRGGCGPRQVEGAALALVHNEGGVLSSHCTVILGRERA